MNQFEEVIQLAKDLKQRIQNDETLTLSKKRLLRHYVTQAEDKRDRAMLKLYTRVGDPDWFSMTRFTAGVLRSNKQDDVVHILEPRHVVAFSTIYDAVKGAALQNTNTVAHSNDESFSVDVLRMFFDRTEEVPRISEIILQRGLTDVDTLAKVLEEMNTSHSSMESGVL